MLDLGTLLHQGTTDWITEQGLTLFGQPLVLHPYQHDIVAAMDMPSVRQVSLMLASQSGKTLVEAIKVIKQLQRHEASGMLVMAREQDVVRFIDSKLQPLIHDHPTLAALLTKKSLNKRHGVSYPPYMFYLGTAGSPASLRGASAPLVLADEVDAWWQTRGHAVARELLDDMRQRQTDFRSDERLLVLASTPESADESIIWGEFQAGNQQHWQVACPACGVVRKLRCVDWLDVEHRCIRCPECGWTGGERERQQLTAAGQWVADNPSVTDHASFTLEELASLNSSLDEVLYKRGIYTERKFRTLVEAQPWSPETVALEPTDVAGVLVAECPWPTTDTVQVTVGVDVQHRRIEATVMAHERGSTRWCVLRHVIIDRAGDSASIRGLIPALQTLEREVLIAAVGADAPAVQLPDGTEWQPAWRAVADRVLIDCGDDRTNVLAAIHAVFVRGKSPQYVLAGRVFPCYGYEPKRSADPTLATWWKNAFRVKSSLVKEHLYQGLETGKGWVVRRGVPSAEEYARRELADYPTQLVSEIQVERNRRTVSQEQRTYKWVKKNPELANEALDCAVYALAAYDCLVEDIHRKKRR